MTATPPPPMPPMLRPDTAGDTALVRVTGLHKHFGQNYVLRGIDLALRPHETVAVIGRSGSGKTTLLRCINFLEEPSLGRVFQEFNLFPHMSVLDNCIEAPMRVRGIPRSEAVEAAERYLAKVSLSDKRDEYPLRLSSGQKQRAAIARALCMDPQVLLFDEPTSALDPELVGEVLRVMEDLAHEGTTMIVVTHEMQFAREAADRVVYVERGVILEEGPPQQVLDSPQHEETQQFLRRLLQR